MKEILITLIIVLLILLFYAFYQFIRNQYQFIRNQKVFEIRARWIDDKDDRWFKYSYDFMYNPKGHNWYGLRYPKDKHYPK